MGFYIGSGSELCRVTLSTLDPLPAQHLGHTCPLLMGRSCYEHGVYIPEPLLSLTRTRNTFLMSISRTKFAVRHGNALFNFEDPLGILRSFCSTP